MQANGEVLSSKTFGYGLKRDSGVERKIKRLLHIADEVCSFVKEHLTAGDLSKIKVVIEGYAYSARGSQNDLAELQGTVKTQLYLMFKIVPVIMPVSKARKHVFGRGRLKKDEILVELGEQGVDFTDHNQADAYVIAKAQNIIDNEEIE